MPEINLHMERDFDRIKPEFSHGTPRVISLHGTPYIGGREERTNLVFTIHIENGDVWGMLNAIAENGGVGAEDDDGTFWFMPWPCAAVEVRDR